jgi:hypothetical protein
MREDPRPNGGIVAMIRWTCAFVLTTISFFSGFLSGQEDRDLREEFCRDARNCVPDTLELVFATAGQRPSVDGPREIEVVEGDRFTTIVVLETKSIGVQAWAYIISRDQRFLSIGEDPCDPDDAYLCGTDGGNARVPWSIRRATEMGLQASSRRVSWRRFP